MTTKKSEQPISFTLLKIPYVYGVESTQELTLIVLPVDGPAAAAEIVKQDKAQKGYGTYYYVLVQGTVVSPHKWVPEDEIAFHP